jgi:[ribosomal protein S18]-alanine N-acetyltransferase
MTALADLHYRPMREPDLAAVATIEAEVYSHPWTLGNFRDSLTAGHACWVVERVDALCAYGVLMMGVDEAHLLNLSVAQALQRQGLGRHLLAFFEARAREFRARAMFLEVRVSNTPARSLYAGAGYREMAVRRNYYPAASGREDAILMGKDL